MAPRRALFPGRVALSPMTGWRALSAGRAGAITHRAHWALGALPRATHPEAAVDRGSGGEQRQAPDDQEVRTHAAPATE
ncbi:MAG: hypothetical protein M0Z87_04450 [Actinomycetota bacterium]|nr:hypothetical protein [Actinomycetota bacterium]